MPRKLIRVILVFLSLSLSHSAFGENAAFDESDQDAAEMARLMRILDEHTEIATKTRLNADYVPGMLTVLYGDDLEARGIHTVWEALHLVPGMDMPFDNAGGTDILVRGVTDNSVAANAKILLDGVSMNVLMYAEASAALQIPIELIDRIEVIRGPGSAVHGEFAYTSLMNIVTKKEENLFFSGFGKYDDYRVGEGVSWSDPERDIHVSLRMSAAEMYDAKIGAGPDILCGMGMESLSNAPGPVRKEHESESVLLDAGCHNTSVIFQYVRTAAPLAYGVVYALPDQERPNILRLRQYGMEARQKMNFFSSLEVSLRLGWMKFQSEFDEVMLYPAGFMGIYPDGMLLNVFYEEQRISGGTDMTWKGWDRHTLFFAYSVSKTEMGDDIWVEINYDALTGEPLPHMKRYEDSEKPQRTVNSMAFQDEFRANDAFTLTTSLRYDSYDDVGDCLSPRIAAVWRLTDHHILKVQYARAFRPPTFGELYSVYNPVLIGNPKLGLSDIDTYEMGYIHKGENTLVRTTLFHSELSHMLVLGQDSQASNQGAAIARGAELEIAQSLTRSLRLNANLSYVDTEDKSYGKEIDGSANWLANAGLMYRPHEKTAFNLQYRYVGERSRAPRDPRNELDAYHTFDITCSFFNVCLKGLILRAGMKNIFDEDVRSPAPMSQDFLGNPIPTYPEDYSHGGREWWVKFSHTF